MKISITLPSIFPVACARAIKNINETTQGDYEIVVVSPFDPGTGDGRVLWVPDGQTKTGAAACQHRAAMAATGDIVAAFADDFLFVDCWDDLIINDFLRREARLPAETPYVLGMRYDCGSLVGTQFGIYYANFPVMRKEQIKKHGWISPDYRMGFGDGDLGMRIWSLGGRCEFSHARVLKVTPDDNRKAGQLFAEEDLKLFIKRWGPRFGNGWDTSHIRGFNHDICPEDNQEILDETKRTVYHNDPVTKKTLPVNGMIAMNKNQPYLVAVVGTKNIVCHHGKFLVVPQSLGPLDLTRPDHRARPGIMSCDTLVAATDIAKRMKE